MNWGSIGVVVGVAFGCVWELQRRIALPSLWNVWGMGLSIGISAALVVALVMLPARRKSVTFRGQVYGVAVALEAAGIGIAVWLLRHLSLQQFLLPAIGFVVGVHFMGYRKQQICRSSAGWRERNAPYAS